MTRSSFPVPLSVERSVGATVHRDVVVVGAGPAGSATAALLAEAGHEVLLLDRARFPRSKPCSEYTGPGSEAILARLGVLRDIDSGLGRRLRGMELRAPNGGRYLVEYRDGARPRTGFALPRADLDAALLAAARVRGAVVWEGFRVTSPLISHGAVRGVVGRDAGGRERTVTARLVAAADGRHSVVAHALGLGKPSRWPPRLGLVTHYRGVRWDEDYGQMRVGRRGYVGVAPLGDDLLTVGLVMPMRSGRLGPPGAAFEGALADYPDLAARLAGGRRVRPVRGVGPLAHSVRSCSGVGYLLVGDAAGFCDPFTGEGIHRALRGAELAADAADRALRAGGGVAGISPEYAAARRAAFRAKERLTAVIQIFVRFPALMDYAIDRLNRRPELGIRLGNVLGDLEPAARALRPAYLWALLGP
jgi:menaquinone-9 beta-reductase